MVMNSTFNNFTGNFTSRMGDGIFVELDNNFALDTLTVTGCTFTNCFNAVSNPGGNAVYAFLNGGELDTMTISGCSMTGNTSSGLITIETNNDGFLSNANIIKNTFSNTSSATMIAANLTNPGTVSNLNIVECSFVDISGGIGIDVENSAGFISNLNIDDCSFENFSAAQGVRVETSLTGIVETMNVKNCRCVNIYSQAAFTIGTADTSAIGNVTFTGNTFTGSNHFSDSIFTQLDSSNPTMFNVWQNTFNDFIGSAQGIGFNANGPVTLNVWNNRFTGFSNANAIDVSVAGLSDVTISGCEFDGLEGFGFAVIMSSSAATSMQITDNRFTNLSGPIDAVAINSSGPSSTALVQGNTFLGDSTVPVGYGASVTVSGGTLCLGFTDNSANPALTPIPYSFIQTGGTFNLTTGSDMSTNTGAFMLTGTIGQPGSCSQ